MFEVHALMTNFIVGSIFLIVSSFLSWREEISAMIKTILLVIGGMFIFFTVSNIGTESGRPIAFSPEPGFYNIQITSINIDEVRAILKIKDSNNRIIEKFVVLPRKGFNADEKFPSIPAFATLEVMEDVRGYKRMTLK